MSALGIGRFLRDYSGALSALAAVVLIAITAYYAHLTHVVATAATEQVREATKTRIDQSMPDVHAYADFLRVGTNEWRVVVRPTNEGAAMAYVYVDLMAECTVNPPHVLFDNSVLLDIPPGKSERVTFTVNASDPNDVAPHGILLKITASGKLRGAHDLFYGTVDDADTTLGEVIPVLVRHERRNYLETGARPTQRRMKKQKKISRSDRL